MPPHAHVGADSGKFSKWMAVLIVLNNGKAWCVAWSILIVGIITSVTIIILDEIYYYHS